MSNVFVFKSRAELSAEQNLNKFIADCRDKLTLYNDQGGWAVNNWHHAHKGKKIAMTFSKYREKSYPSNFDPMDEPFLSFAKSYIRYTQSHNPVTSLANKMVVLRQLHDAILEVYQEANILNIDGLILSRLEDLVKQRVPNKDRLNKVGYQIEVLLDFIRDEVSVLPALISWVNPWPKQKAKAERTDKESRAWQNDRCPSMHQMLALAECFAKAESREDKYWSSILVLLMFAPGRAGELLDLTIDSLYHGENGALGVRWYGEKGFGHTIKWVPKDLESTVIEAHKRLLEISKPARYAAKFAHDNPDVFMRHDRCTTPVNFPEDKPLDVVQFGYAMGYSGDAIERVIKNSRTIDSDTAWGMLTGGMTKWIKSLRENGNPSYYDLAKYIGKEYKRKYWPNLPSIDRPIWESLVLIRDREFHNSFLPREFSWRLSSVNELNAQIKQRHGLTHPPKTIFQRFGYKDEDGTDIGLTSHQLRVWLSTNAERGGMDAWQLARWAGRSRVADNRHYDLRTQQECEEQVRSIMQFDERPTALEAVKLNLPVSYKDLGVNRIGIADVTEYGMCVHDYAMSPCTKGGGDECMTCKEHACIKGMPKTLERIKRLEEQVEFLLGKAEIAVNDAVFGADRWVTHLGWKLTHIRGVRQIMESEETPEGTVIWIPPEHDPSPTKRALEQQGLKVKADEEERVPESTISMLMGIDNA
ncbi:hypothetical protein [Endozoicomonas ascidiicola]|uniref:hypothetical protein n=1 Tax=Endozoicomonas ascidiicola TaxID=1698521 RepID=UPI00082F9DA2|nr:hypothetical protein [Endozoicomonas ascidiicola]